MTHTLKVDHDSWRQLTDQMILLWRRRSSSAPREGLLASLTCCPNPACACGEVGVDVLLVDERLLEVRLDDGSIRTVERPRAIGESEPEPRRRMHGWIDLDKRTVRVEKDSPAQDDDLRAWLEDELDPALMAHLRAGYDRAKWRGLSANEHTAALTSKPGRNDSCPCGSGKKLKRCCGR